MKTESRVMPGHWGAVYVLPCQRSCFRDGRGVSSRGVLTGDTCYLNGVAFVYDRANGWRRRGSRPDSARLRRTSPSRSGVKREKLTNSNAGRTDNEQTEFRTKGNPTMNEQTRENVNFPIDLELADVAKLGAAQTEQGGYAEKLRRIKEACDDLGAIAGAALRLRDRILTGDAPIPDHGTVDRDTWEAIARYLTDRLLSDPADLRFESIRLISGRHERRTRQGTQGMPAVRLGNGPAGDRAAY